MAVRDRSTEQLLVCDLGTVGYLDALSIQEAVRSRRQAGELPDTLLLLEHPPVYTLGRRADAQELPLAERFYRERGIELHSCDRGGRITYHGPGQLVGYPIVAIDDVVEYVRALEQGIVAALAREGVAARSRADEGPDYTGVWVKERKIASIGVHVQRGVTTHGFAVNVSNDLEPFDWIVACGLPGVSMTSIAEQLDGAATVGIGCFRKEMAYRFCEAHARRQRLVSSLRLGIDTTNAAGLAAERAPIKSAPPRPAQAVPA